VTAELTPSERGCVMQFTFPRTNEANVVIDLFDGAPYIKIIQGENKIVGYSTQGAKANSTRVLPGFRNYFVIVFDKVIKDFSIWKNDGFIQNINEATGSTVGAVISFSTANKEVVSARVASSFISFEQAGLNLKRELTGKTFDQVRDIGQKSWNKLLSRFSIEDNNIDDLDNVRTFYTTLYRTMLFPREFFEYDANNKIVHWSPFNGEITSGRMYVDNGYWDTFRAAQPFINIFFPGQCKFILDGVSNTYRESGWLPEWISPGHFNCMVGSNSASIVASAYLNGVRDVDINTLWEALYKNAYNAHPTIMSVGRAGIEKYDKLGYVPYDINVRESAARTLEYAYADFCMMKLARSLGKDQSIVEVFKRRAFNYKNLFYKKYNLMAGKDSNGNFRTDFNPFAWGGDFTEGNSWHYTWSVFQDFEGLARLMGGQKEFVNMLDSIFKMPPVFDYKAYGQVIHEMREMQIMNFGQYAHGNQPIQHMLYLYDWTNEPWKTQYWTRQAMSRLYHPTPDGYCGDEDNGQTSAWYVFSALGFYPVCPVTGEYAIGSPLFKKVTITLESGKKLTINAPNNNSENVYINSVKINGKEYSKNYFTHSLLQQGGVIDFEMTAKPNSLRGTAPSAFPFSLSSQK
jgi:predicted alpha-1,2-mannosidase